MRSFPWGGGEASRGEEVVALRRKSVWWRKPALRLRWRWRWMSVPGPTLHRIIVCDHYDKPKGESNSTPLISMDFLGVFRGNGESPRPAPAGA